MEPSRAVDAEVYASHFQFYVVDPEADWDPPDWNGVELEQHVGVGTGLVGIGTAAYEVVPVRLEVWPDEPPLDEAWDHVVEASLEVRSGRVGLGSVDGLDDVETIPVEPATYRVRSSAAGLDGATELDAGDSYRLQLWPAAAAAPAVVRWWPGWDPARATPRPTTPAGHVVLGADAHEARATMRWLASRGQAHLFRGCEGTLWEHSTLLDRAGTPQLEELDVDEAERRYGGPGSWGRLPGSPGVGLLAKSLWQTLRSRRGTPAPDPVDAVVEDGRRAYLGTTAYARLVGLHWLASESGHAVYRDEEGCLWEFRNEDAAAGRARLTELTPDEARAKYGVEAG